LGQNTLTGVEGAYHTNEVSFETRIPILGGDFSFPGMQRSRLLLRAPPIALLLVFPQALSRT
jgi:hypothetical protein